MTIECPAKVLNIVLEIACRFGKVKVTSKDAWCKVSFSTKGTGVKGAENAVSWANDFIALVPMDFSPKNKCAPFARMRKL